jgi:DNA-binding NarL/FixJ family response regulator
MHPPAHWRPERTGAESARVLERILEPIRVLIVDLPGILRDIVRATVSRQPDMVVVGELGKAEAVRPAIESTSASVVVINSQHPAARPDGDSILGRASALKVLAVDPDARESSLHTLRPHRTALGELSPRYLLAAIRSDRDAARALTEQHSDQ